nr:hypothetical protein [Tessaracoccus coleopterorum]
MIGALTTVLGPVAQLMILLGNALTPAAATPTGRSPPRPSCVTSSTWRRPTSSSRPASRR